MAKEVCDIAVIGAGFGGVYAAYRFSQDGLSVVGIEGASGFGGTWYHNTYPGSRVDTDSVDMYSYLFSREIYDGWVWKERYATAQELTEHINWVADKLDVRRLFRFDTWLREARWSSQDKRWHLKTDTGEEIACRFLVMCTGNLSEPKPIPFPGLKSSRASGCRPIAGRIARSASRASESPSSAPARRASRRYRWWPKKRTSSSYSSARRITAFPARNGPHDIEKQHRISANLADYKESMLARPTLPVGQEDRKKATEYTPEERRERMENNGPMAATAWPMFSRISASTGISNESPRNSCARRSASRSKIPSSPKSSAPIIRSAPAA